jgi:hypothetical protein
MSKYLSVALGFNPGGEIIKLQIRKSLSDATSSIKVLELDLLLIN